MPSQLKTRFLHLSIVDIEFHIRNRITASIVLIKMLIELSIGIYPENLFTSFGKFHCKRNIPKKLAGIG